MACRFVGILWFDVEWTADDMHIFWRWPADLLMTLPVQDTPKFLGITQFSATWLPSSGATKLDLRVIWSFVGTGAVLNSILEDLHRFVRPDAFDEGRLTEGLAGSPGVSNVEQFWIEFWRHRWSPGIPWLEFRVDGEMDVAFCCLEYTTIHPWAHCKY